MRGHSDQRGDSGRVINEPAVSSLPFGSSDLFRLVLTCQASRSPSLQAAQATRMPLTAGSWTSPRPAPSSSACCPPQGGGCRWNAAAWRRARPRCWPRCGRCRRRARARSCWSGWQTSWPRCGDCLLYRVGWGAEPASFEGVFNLALSVRLCHHAVPFAATLIRLVVPTKESVSD